MGQPDNADESGRLSRSRLVLLFALSMTASAGNTGMQSIMPAIGAALKVPDIWVSVAYTWPAVLWVVFAPIWARRSDRQGLKALMRLGLIGFVVSFALCAAVLYAGLNAMIPAGATLLLFALCRAFYSSLGSATPTAAQAYVASRTPRDDRTRVLALLASAFGIGTVMGPGLAPLFILPGLGLATPFVSFTLAGLAMLVALQALLPDDVPEVQTADSRSAPVEAKRLRLADLRLRPWLWAGLAGGHAHSALIGVTGFLVMDRLGLRGHAELAGKPIGVVMMSGAAATLLAQWLVIPYFRLGPRRCTLWGMVLAIAGCALLAFAPQLGAITLGYALGALGFGLFRPGFAAGASLAVSRAEQGQVAGIVTAVNGAGFILAPATGVWLFNHAPLAAFAAIGLLCLTVIVIALRTVPADSGS